MTIKRPSQFLLEDRHPNRANVYKRTLAYAIDVTISIAIGIIVDIFWSQTVAPDIKYKITQDLGRDFYNLMRTYLSFGFIFGFSFGLVVFKDILGSFSFGKRVMGLVIYDYNTQQPCHYSQIIKRSFMAFVLILFILLFPIVKTEILIIILIVLSLCNIMIVSAQRNHRSIGDWVGNTMVVEKNHEAT